MKANTRKKKNSSVKYFLVNIILAFVVPLISFLIISQFVIIGQIPTGSMNPTLKINDRIIIKKNINEIERGKIYAFKLGNMTLIKRCIAIGGDHVSIKDDDVYLNGDKLDEVYVSSKIKENVNWEHIDCDVIVPEGQVLFMGDNRANSYDSRYWDNKFVDETDVVGIATKIISPFSRIGSDLFY